MPPVLLQGAAGVLRCKEKLRYFYIVYKPLHRAGCSGFFAGIKPSQALPRQLSRRGSQAGSPVAKVLGSMRKLPAVLLALPLGELSPQVTERAHAVSLILKYQTQQETLPSPPKAVPLGKVAANVVSRRKGYPQQAVYRLIYQFVAFHGGY